MHQLREDMGHVLNYLNFVGAGTPRIYLRNPYQYARRGMKVEGDIWWPGGERSLADLWIWREHLNRGTYLAVGSHQQIVGLWPDSKSHHQRHWKVSLGADYCWVAEEAWERVSKFFVKRAKSRFRPPAVRKACACWAQELHAAAPTTKPLFFYGGVKKVAQLETPVNAFDERKVPEEAFESWFKAFLHWVDRVTS